MNVDPAPILALISELYATSQGQQQRITELETEVRRLQEALDAADDQHHDQ